MTTDTVPKARIAPRRRRRRAGHGHRHRQGRGNDPPGHGDDARRSSPPTRRSPRRCSAQIAREVADVSFNGATVDGDTSTNDSFVHRRDGQGGHGADHAAPAIRGWSPIRAAIEEVAIDAGAGHRPRRRRRDQVHRDSRRRRQDRRRVQARRVRHRAFAAGQDGVLRLRPEPRPHRVRDRQHGGRRHRHRRHFVLARRRAGRRPRRPRRELPRGRRPARDEAGRDRRARATSAAATRRPPCGRAISRTTTSPSTRTTAPDMRATDRRPGRADRARRRACWRASRRCCRRRRPTRTGRRSPPRAGASTAGAATCRAIAHPHAIRLDDLVAVDEQKQAIDRNTRQFVAGLPANNVLLTGSRGTGKSSLVKAMLAKYAAQGPARSSKSTRATSSTCPTSPTASRAAPSASSSSATT